MIRMKGIEPSVVRLYESIQLHVQVVANNQATGHTWLHLGTRIMTTLMQHIGSKCTYLIAKCVDV